MLSGKQVTRGHNIAADGWVGASNLHPHPNPPPTLKHTQKVSKTPFFRDIEKSFQEVTPIGPEPHQFFSF